MSKFLKGDPEWAGLYGVVEEGSKIGFGRRVPISKQELHKQV
jgi:hypothetical protein